MKKIIMHFKYLLIFLGVIICSACTAQHKSSTKSECVIEYDSTLKTKIYTYVDEMPKFDKGEISLADFFTKNFHYPEDQEKSQGSVWLVFIVDENGQVQKGAIFNKRVEELSLVDKEALRILSVMPRWRPGSCKGLKVPVRVLWPIRF